MNIMIWLFPAVFLIHDLEEILTVERWTRTHLGSLRERFGQNRLMQTALQWADGQGTAQFSTVVALLFVAVFLASYLAAAGNYLWYVAGVTILFINVFTHVGQALLFGGYTPGVVTALAVALPYCVYAYWHLFTAGIVSWPSVLWSVPIGLGVVVPIFLVGHLLGWFIFRSASG